MNLIFTVVSRYEVELDVGDDFDLACKQIYETTADVVAKAKKYDESVDWIEEHSRRKAKPA